MKKLFGFLLCAIFLIAATSAVTAKERQLRILGIGNSFTDDGMMYLPDLLQNADIEGVTLGRLYYGGCSLEQHCNFHRDSAKVYVYSKSVENKWVTIDKKSTMAAAVTDEPWDIIVLQQSSPLGGIYQSYQPFLNDLMGIVRTLCSNPDVEIVWQMTWAYSKTSSRKAYANYDNDQSVMYAATCDATGQMKKESGIKRIIPSGVAIQMLRQTELNNPPLELTRDSYHLDFGIGRYAAACCWFQKLVTPVYGKSIVGNPFRVESKTTSVTDSNSLAIQKCVRKACKYRF